jgi:hypothetical protein
MPWGRAKSFRREEASQPVGRFLADVRSRSSPATNGAALRVDGGLIPTIGQELNLCIDRLTRTASEETPASHHSVEKSGFEVMATVDVALQYHRSTLHWEADPPRRRANVRKVTYWPHILLLQTHIAVTPFGSSLVRF